MRYIIIGLGIYGSNLAKDLTAMGHEVIGADSRPSNVEAVKNYISTVYTFDSTDETALNVLPLTDVDVVIVAIGENFGASVKTVALLKKAGVKKIYARAVDDIHQAILQGMSVDRILTPEQRAAFDLTQEMLLGNTTEALRIATHHYVMRFAAPEYFFGQKYAALSLHNNFGLDLIAVTRPVKSRNIIGISTVTQLPFDWHTDTESRVEDGDIFVCYGSASAFKKLMNHIG